MGTVCALLALAASTLIAVAPAAPGYRMAAVRGARVTAALRDSLGAATWRLALRLNRVDEAHAARLDSLLVPIAAADSSAMSPFPAALPVPTDSGRVLLVSCRVQAFAAYEDGARVRWGAVSTGAESLPTAPGLYRANWMARRHVSTVDTSWVMRWAINLDQRSGLALHEYDLPGRPASHNCVRLMRDDARWLFVWIEARRLAPDGRTVIREGTPVRIFGAYDFRSPPPWRRLSADPAALDMIAAKIESVLAGR